MDSLITNILLNPLESVADHWKEIILSYTWGVLSSLSPCVVVLIPLLLYHFTAIPTSTRPYSLFLFVIGFEGAYISGGLFLQLAIGTIGQSGLKLGLGSGFLILGILSLRGRINGPTIPVLKRPFFAGCCFAAAVASNPCSLPYLAAIFQLGPSAALRSATAFGFGVITPALITALAGREFLRKAWIRPVMGYFSYLTGAFLPLSGVWMLYTGAKYAGKEVLTLGDALVAANLFAIVVVIVLGKIVDGGKSLSKNQWVLKLNDIQKYIVLLLLNVVIGLLWLSHSHSLFAVGSRVGDADTCPAEPDETAADVCSMCSLFVYGFAVISYVLCGVVMFDEWWDELKPSLSKLYKLEVMWRSTVGLPDELV